MPSPARLGLAISAAFQRSAPDPFAIAILLSLLTALLALVLGWPPDAGESWLATRRDAALALLDGWRADSGLWKLLAFGMQMCLVLVSGHALAAAPPVRRLLERLAGMPRSGPGAAAFVALVACLAGLLNWGLGLIVGSVLAREVGRSCAVRGIPAHYPLLCAAGYTCMMVWHGGLSGSAPLSVTTLAGASSTMPPELAQRLVGSGIPLAQTLFSPLNLLVTGGLVLLIPAVLWLLAPRDPGHATPPPAMAATEEGVPALPAPRTLPERLERRPWLSLLLGLALAAGFLRFAATRGLGSLGLNEVNAAMLALGLLLHGSPVRFAAAIEEGARGCAGIILQFPLYAGIMAMLVASGLMSRFAEGLTQAGGAATVPLFSFASAAVANLFIPSGGGQWAVQGPIALEAGAAVGVAPGTMVMSVAYGDQLTNMLQPFWALPLLAITGARASEVVGYTAIVMVAGAAWIALGLMVAG